MREREPQHEIIVRGELFTLSHPGTTNTFSGYGLTIETDRKDLLVGLLMVDRPPLHNGLTTPPEAKRAMLTKKTCSSYNATRFHKLVFLEVKDGLAKSDCA